MLIINNSSELVKEITKLKSNNETIAFVPTMGNLHKGHLHLVSLASESATIVIVSIFVNPLQFNQASDLENYPRSLEHDIALCMENAVDIVFTPSVEDIYPKGKNGERVELPELSLLSTTLEGASRPDHFSGVVTVVKKLFDLVKPDVAVFGEKDFQQLLVIQKMVAVLNLSVKIISSKTIRETDGLAMSSRNSKLPDDARLKAAKIYCVLKSIREQIKLAEIHLDEIFNSAISELTQSGFKVDYLVAKDCDDFSTTLNKAQNECVILVAVELNGIRLIDNLRI